ncbi:hypothetical protein D9M71_806900 [compost metagenome]
MGIEVADVVADEHLPGTGDDQVQLVFLVKMPAHQRAGKTMLTVDDGQAVVVVHQFVGRIGDSGGACHVRCGLLVFQAPIMHPRPRQFQFASLMSFAVPWKS